MMVATSGSLNAAMSSRRKREQAAYPSVTSLGRVWFTNRLVREGCSISSRSATVMKQLRSPWNQNFAPPALLMRR